MATLTVFLSSTFRDFHQERDLFVGPLRAELDELVAGQGCRVEIVDLRWGVQADGDAPDKMDRVLDVCLREIDRSRPLFVGLIGNRFGWVPEVERMDRVAADVGLAGQFANWSVTAVEFEHGGLRGTNDAVFFERHVIGAGPTDFYDSDPAQMNWLREHVRRNAVRAIVPYEATVRPDGRLDLDDFRRAAVASIGPVLLARAREIAAAGLDPVAAAMQIFLDDHVVDLAGRDDEQRRVYEAVAAGRNVCLLGPSGVGKSSLWSRTMLDARAAGHRVIALSAAASAELATPFDVLMRIASEMGLSVPAGDFASMRKWLHSAAAAIGPVTVGIDALDVLDRAGSSEVTAGVAALPRNASTIVSTTSEAHAADLARLGFKVIDVAPLTSVQATEVVRAALARRSRSLPPAAIGRLVDRPRSPLWLTLAIGELNALGDEAFRAIDPSADAVTALADLVDRTVAALPDGLPELVSRIADRAAGAFGRRAVAVVCGLLAVSRSGLAPMDLSALTGLDALTVAGIRRAFGGLLAPTGDGGRLRFTHSLVRETAETRFVGARRGDFDRALARHLASGPDDPTRAQDALWHTLWSGGRPALAGLLPPPADDAGFTRALPVFMSAVEVVPPAIMAAALDTADTAALTFLVVALDVASPHHRMDLATPTRLRIAEAVEAVAAGRVGTDLDQHSWLPVLTLANLADAAEAVGDLPRAERTFRAAVSLADVLVSAGAGPYERYAPVIFQRYAALLDGEARYGEAVAVMQCALKILRSAARDDEEDTLAALCTGLRNAELLCKHAARVESQAEYKKERQAAEYRLVTALGPDRVDFVDDLDEADRGVPQDTDPIGSDPGEESLDPRDPRIQGARDWAAREPGNRRALRELVEVLTYAADGASENDDDAPLGCSLGREAVRAAEALLTLDPSDVEAQAWLSHAYNALGRAAIMAEDLPLVDHAYREALVIDRARLERSPTSIIVIRRLGGTLQGAGRIAQELRRYDEAMALFEERVRLLEQVEARTGRTAHAQVELATAHYDVADLASDLGRAEASRAAYIRAVEAFEHAFAAGEPDETLDDLFTIVWDGLSAPMEAGDDVAALALLGPAIRIVESRMTDRSDPDHLVRASIFLAVHGGCLANLGEPRAAVRSLLRSVVVLNNVQANRSEEFKIARDGVRENLKTYSRMIAGQRGTTLGADRRELVRLSSGVAAKLKFSVKQAAASIPAKWLE